MKTSRRLTALAYLSLGSLALAACGGGFDESSSDSKGSGELSVLIGSSGDAETNAVKEAVSSWSSGSGTKAEVTVAADLSQQLSQGFASGKPADVFYVPADLFAGFAANGSLEAYGDSLANKDDFYESLRQIFTHDGKLYCAPKDFSTLALIINTDLWTKAGLTDADIPTTWEQLEAVSKKLTADNVVGLAMTPEYARVGTFFTQAGANLVNDDGTAATADAEGNVKGLEFAKKLQADGVMKFSSELGDGWGGESFGKAKAAMTIEGNWITGALKSDYPDLKYKVAELPAGPAGKGTLQFSNCWGIAADSKNKDEAKKLVEQLTGSDQQAKFAKAFGVMPSIKSAADAFKAEFPENAAFLSSQEFAKNVPTGVGTADVVKDFNSKLDTLSTGDPKAILEQTQTELQSVLDKNKK